jgi:hypothetical protein
MPEGVEHKPPYYPQRHRSECEKCPAGAMPSRLSKPERVPLDPRANSLRAEEKFASAESDNGNYYDRQQDPHTQPEQLADQPGQYNPGDPKYLREEPPECFQLASPSTPKPQNDDGADNGCDIKH